MSGMAEVAVVQEVLPTGGSLVNAVSYSAILITIGLFSAGMYVSLSHSPQYCIMLHLSLYRLTCRKIHNSKSVGAVPHIPFVAAAVK